MAQGLWWLSPREAIKITVIKCQYAHGNASSCRSRSMNFLQTPPQSTATMIKSLDGPKRLRAQADGYDRMILQEFVFRLPDRRRGRLP